MDERPSPRPRRRYSIWSLLAPAALFIVVIWTLTALASDDPVPAAKPATKKPAAATATSTTPTTSNEAATTGTTDTTSTTPVQKRFVVIQSGDSLASIAATEGATTQELQTLNPQITDPQALRVGERIRVE